MASASDWLPRLTGNPLQLRVAVEPGCHVDADLMHVYLLAKAKRTAGFVMCYLNIIPVVVMDVVLPVREIMSYIFVCPT